MTSEQFDYIIVGAGSAGCVLANRLSADPSKSVCLLEAGPKDTSILIKIPAGILGLMWDPRHNWRYYSEPEPQMNDRKMYCPRGKVIGGSSSINAMCFSRGSAEDFERWNTNGVKGWGWNDLLPHFIATQKQLKPSMNPDRHGYEGEQRVADVSHVVDELSHKFIDAVVESGLAPKTDDLGSETVEGTGYYQTYQNGEGRRYSGADAFLHPVADRPNLTVITKAFVEKIIFDGKTAVGIQLKKGFKRFTITARDEVILSAGAINSPQLLMLSGVGDSEELSKHKIEPVHHLPGVGNNLSDHLDVIINTRIKGYKGMGISIPGLAKLAVQTVGFFFNGKGALASNGAEAGGFIKSDPQLDVPNIQLHFSPVILERHFLRNVGHGHSLHVCNLQPKSRGSVSLRSANPRKQPKIQFNYCEHPDDMDVMVKAVKLGRKILAGASLKQFEKRENMPGVDVQSDDEIKAFIREKAETIYHPVGTCKMGTDDMAVVDEQLRVRGLKNLRVVDASMMPNINSGNTHATVVAIANKAAAMIKEQPAG